MTALVLPLCDDEVLLRELAAVAHTGWDLPSRPTRESAVRHLLLLSDVGPGASFAERAHRLLVMLDQALLPDPNDPDLPLEEDDSLGLRILFGAHGRYRTERSPVVRRAEASEYLELSWRDRPIRDRAGTFLRRRQKDALRIALERLRHVYGQDRSDSRAFDTVSVHRRYRVGRNRQLLEIRCEETLRARLDDRVTYEWYEPRHSEPGLLAHEFRLRTDGTTPGVTLGGITDDPVRSGMREVSLALSAPIEAGQLLRLAWSETYQWSPHVNQWGRFHVGCQAPNDHFAVTLSVSFEPGGELPDWIWWATLLPDVDVGEVGPARDQALALNGGRDYSHEWTASSTERRSDYVLIWTWSTSEPTV